MLSSAHELRQNAMGIFTEGHNTLQRKTEAKKIINEFFYFNAPVETVQRLYDIVNK